MTTKRRTTTRRGEMLDFKSFFGLLSGYPMRHRDPLTRDEAEEAYWRERDRFHRHWDPRSDRSPPFAILFFEPEVAPGWDLDTEYPKAGQPLEDLPGWYQGCVRLDELWEQEEPCHQHANNPKH